QELLHADRHLLDEAAPEPPAHRPVGDPADPGRLVALEQEALALEQRPGARLAGVEAGALALKMNELAVLRLPVLVEPVGVDEAVADLVGLVQDGFEEDFAHGCSPQDAGEPAP